MSNAVVELDQVQSVVVESHDSDNNAGTEAETRTNVTEKQKHLASEHKQFYKRELLEKFVLKMYAVLKEVVLLLLLAITYAALTNDPPKISKSPAAFPFFPKGSVVTDWYRGQITVAIEKARESDIAFIMYYAPWDAESQVVKDEFELTARYMYKHISFSAVNCWQPGSDCRRQYSKAYNWPVLIAYTAHGKGIQYKGSRTAPHMIKFLSVLAKPLIRITKNTDVNNLLTKYDAVIAARVSARPGNMDFAVYYTIALRFLERDPYQEVAFAVHTEHDRQEPPVLKLQLWNETLIYPNDGEWKPDALLTWIVKNIHQVTMWFTPTGSKSLGLSNYLQPGPSLVLFTPRNPLDVWVDYYDLLYEVGLEYYNCEKQPFLRRNRQSVHVERVESYYKYKDLLRECSSKFDGSPMFPSTVTYKLPTRWINSSCCVSTSRIRTGVCAKCDHLQSIMERRPEQCKSLKDCGECSTQHSSKHSSFFDKTRLRTCEGNNCESCTKKYKTSEITGESDSRSPRSLQNISRQEKCRIAHIAQKVNSIFFSGSLKNRQKADGDDIEGFACKTNASLTLIAVDSLKYYHFAERLGIDVLNRTDKTTVVIIDEKMETHHVMKQPFNDDSVRQFISNFTQSKLPRAFLSVNFVGSKRSHTYPAQSCRSISNGQFCVVELDSETFLPTAMQPNKAVIVLYHTKQCSFCNGISYMYLSAAKIFSSVDAIEFARIDGDLNTLPWEYTMETYPTILFFPIEKKSESRAFPRSMPITIPNLVNFVLSNLDANVKLHAMWATCMQLKFEDEKQTCISSLRVENLSAIDQTLRDWRNADTRTKAELLHKLKKLRNINLLLAHSPNNISSVQRYLVMLYSQVKQVTSSSSENEHRKHKKSHTEL